MNDDIPTGAMTDASAPHTARPRSVLICHHDAPIHSEGVARWLASWTHLAGVMVIREPAAVRRRRIGRERRRVGLLRLVDVLAFRLHYRLFAGAADARWLRERGDELAVRYPAAIPAPPRLEVATPNSPESQAFLEQSRPDLVIALCKTLLTERIFTIARHGTYVFHPGICPEYRNAHGCFWALASDDLERVGMSLIRIDRGIDTGPIFGYFTTGFDELQHSHARIQHAVVLDNLDAIRDRLLEVMTGNIRPEDVSGRASREFGQPWLTAYWRWQRRARRRRARHRA